MTISSGIEGQNTSALASPSKKTAETPAAQKSEKAAQSPTQEAPAVLVDAAAQKPVTDDNLAITAEIGSAEEALNLAKSIGAALSEQSQSIANQSAGAVAGLLSEAEAAFG